ncbi:hypothetical protein E2C01_048530 [Portunus trituberculatus]|uniref:Uncharacterized protein n=1 Tax=Portunus trituberculatus TaxID=210409 RepID=A0A5B7GB62_PORTR|nr:hypothetical protein [Portunus trituberculatus]
MSRLRSRAGWLVDHEVGATLTNIVLALLLAVAIAQFIKRRRKVSLVHYTSNQTAGQTIDYSYH